LQNADFSEVTAGLQNHWKILLICIWCFVASVLGFTVVFAAQLITLIFETNKVQNVIAGCIFGLVLIGFFINALYKGIVNSRGVVSLAFALAFTVAYIVPIIITNFIFGCIPLLISFAFALAHLRLNLAPSYSVLVAVYVMILCVYISWRALLKDEKHISILEFILPFAVIKNSTFQGADLTNANFTSAVLKGSDFRQAKLEQICWNGVKNIHLICFDDHRLKNSKIQKLIAERVGDGESFDELNLASMNLQGASLRGASFIRTNLSHCNLQDSDLSYAILKQVQLDGTDLENTTISGATIEDWGITSTTNLKSLKCDHVYMRLPTKERRNPLRKPDNEKEVFSDGEFAQFIQPYTDTLDL
jgi:uncharacterized protein YjbI with pentapeptide repeats